MLIVAGGPSVQFAEVEKCRGRFPIIAVNNSYTRVPWANVLYFADARWWGWHCRGVLLFAGEVATIGNYAVVAKSPRSVHSFLCGSSKGLSFLPDMLSSGMNATYQAINLAVLAGARRIITMGLDMRQVAGRSHWHKGHPVKATPDHIYAEAMIPRFATMVPALKAAGVEVLNASPGSALTTFPIIAPEEVFNL